MQMLAKKFTKLKTSIGGNREKFKFENTFGMPKEEQFYVTRPNRANTRILSELEFAMNLSTSEEGKYDQEIEAALDYLLERIENQGVITNDDCQHAEVLLEPLEEPAKAYQLILAAHAHIDMNWMWSFNETVAVTLATFRSILNIMDQYPDFYFSQSQAAVYKIVEEYDPSLMEEIKKRIEEGRWEVTATAWVETDKNMPSGESLLRHIQYTKEYLSTVWGVEDFDLDFSPDTFGHSGNVPEINQFGDVKYYYHCRGNARDNVLYRYQAPSGKEVIAYQEPNWYNGAITPQMGAGLIEISRRSAGLKTGLVIYGVGNHGGGPTRRDVERALDMMTWKIYPKIKFGTIREYFKEAESVRDQLPIVDQELNYFAPGCYTTQSRIKRGNRRLETALLDAESLALLAGEKVGFKFERDRLVKSWQDVLFIHFHDILTGSCVQDTREHAMGMFQTSMATANTQLQNAMRVISEQIDTSSILVDIDAYNSQSEGAGAGFGIENFVGVPSTERGSGKTRIFHVFNTRAQKRKEVVELTVWDWTGDLRYLEMKDYLGNPLVFQLLDRDYQNYWDHKYIRVLVEVEVPALGYTTIVLSQKDPTSYKVYLQDQDQVSRLFDDYEFSNDEITVKIDSLTGRIYSLSSNATGEEMIAKGEFAGLNFIETEKSSSSAWDIGRHLKEVPVERCLNIECVTRGPLRQSIKVNYQVASSTIEVIYTLDKNEPTVQMDMKIDWHEIGSETIPVLDYRVPLAYETEVYQYDIPAGMTQRGEVTNDVPALQYGMAVNEQGLSAVLMSDSKYGYRGGNHTIALSLINSSTSPDPYPERGIHHLTLWLGISNGDAKVTKDMASLRNHSVFYQPSNSHNGTLPMEDSLLEASSDNVVISAVLPSEDGAMLIRGYETTGGKGNINLIFKDSITAAVGVNLFEEEVPLEVKVDRQTVSVDVEAYSLFEVKVRS